MRKQIIATDAAPKAVGPYSQAVRSGDFLFCSGQIPLDPQTGEMTGSDVKTQTTRVLENIKQLLASEGLGMGNVIKATVFMVNLADFAIMNEVYAGYFKESSPARSTIQVAALPKGALVEIEVIAHY